MNFKFQLTAEGDARLVSASGEDGVAAIPDVWEGHPVTVIGEEAFYGNHNLHRVRLPKHLKKIEGHALQNVVFWSRRTFRRERKVLGITVFITASVSGGWCFRQH